MTTSVTKRHIGMIMQMSPYRLIWGIVLLITMLSCEDDEYFQEVEGVSPTEFYQNFGNETTAAIFGQVVSELGMPVAEAEVTVGTTTVSTDSKGIFSIKNANVFERFAYVKVSKPGHIPNSRSLTPSLGANKITIVLPEINPIATISANEVALVNLNSGAVLKFNGRYVNSSGQDYSGMVSVIISHTNIDDNGFFTRMPGMLYGMDTLGGENQLESLGIVSVTLLGENNEELQLKEGEVVEVSMPISTNQLQIAENTIPTWHFNTDHGFWIEEGSATIENGNYTTDFTNLKDWNFARPRTTAVLCLDVVSGANLPMSNIRVEITTQNNTTIQPKLSNELGKVCAFVPVNQPLTIRLYDFCGTLIDTQNVNAINTDTQTTLQLLNTNIQEVNIKGTFYDCEMESITNGYVFLERNGRSYFDYIDNGSYEINTILCEPGVEVTAHGIDIDTGVQSNEIVFRLIAPETNIGAFSICASVEGAAEYIIFNIDGGTTEVFTTDMYCFLSVLPNPLFIAGKTDQMASFNHIGFAFGPNVLNELNATIYNYSENNDLTNLAENEVLFQVDNSGMLNDPQPNSNMFIEVTKFGAVGEYVDFNFNGTFFYGGNQHTIIGVAHLLRDP
ncbi:MAG: hypothetical protein HRT68_11070 [Flavobacteriaceae bacterium]|nr:hypothetical protein [Flavobacteriaceae bacterium]